MPPEAGEKSEPAVVVATPLEKWNEPRANAARYMTTLYSFIVIGMNDGAIGALIPYVSVGSLPARTARSRSCQQPD